MAREEKPIGASSAARTREPDTGGAAAPVTGCGPGRWTHGRPAAGRSPRSDRGAGGRSRPLRPPVGPGRRDRPSPAAGPAPPGRRHAADGSPGGGPPSSRPPCPRRNRPADPTRPSRPRHRARDGKGGSGGPWLAAPHAGRTGRPRRTPDAGAGGPARATPQAESFSRPLRRRPARIARPARGRIRSRKPWGLDRPGVGGRAGGGPHPRPEAVGLGPAAVVRLERALAHGVLLLHDIGGAHPPVGGRARGTRSNGGSRTPVPRKLVTLRCGIRRIPDLHGWTAPGAGRP